MDEQSRHAAAAALPGRLHAPPLKVRGVNAQLRAMSEARKRLENGGGERSESLRK